MESVIGGALLLIFVLGIGPATRGTAAAIQSIEDPGKPEIQEECNRANSDLVRLLVLLAATFGLMFVWKLGG